MELDVQERVTDVNYKGREGRNRQEEPLEGNKVLTPWKQRGKEDWAIIVSNCNAVPREV